MGVDRGFGADLALDAYVSQKLGLADCQDTGNVLDEVAGEAVEAANSATTDVKRAHKERRGLEQRVKELEARVREVEDKVEKIRLAIQEYLDSFAPYR